MRLLHQTTEDDMIAVFLKTEITSERFGHLILQQLTQDNRLRTIVDHPDISRAADNAYRHQLLASYRAYVFDDLPAHTRWYRAMMSPDDVATIRYIDYSYWNELSNHTRLPIHAVDTIRSGRAIYNVSPAGFLTMADALRNGAHFPALILVSATPGAPVTVFEGHARLTAYMLAPEYLPPELEVVIGFAPECATI